jgi:hypothetical protein
MDDEHYLTAFLNEQLQALGLDADTYGPYLTGEGSLFNSDSTAGDDDEEVDSDELDSVLELLQASSETHEEDPDAFAHLKTQLLQRRQQHLVTSKQQHQEKQELDKQEKQRKKQLDLEKAQLAEKKKEEDRLERLNNQTEDQRLAKLKLVEEYGYEQEDVADEEGDDEDGGGDAGGGAGGGSLNHNNSTAIEKEKRQAMRQQSSEQKTKAKEETKQAKLSKEEAKEDRRKRAQKGERQR